MTDFENEPLTPAEREQVEACADAMREVSDAIMHVHGFRPGLGLPFDGMPSEWFDSPADGLDVGLEGFGDDDPELLERMLAGSMPGPDPDPFPYGSMLGEGFDPTDVPAEVFGPVDPHPEGAWGGWGTPGFVPPVDPDRPYHGPGFQPGQAPQYCGASGLVRVPPAKDFLIARGECIDRITDLDRTIKALQGQRAEELARAQRLALTSVADAATTANLRTGGRFGSGGGSRAQELEMRCLQLEIASALHLPERTVARMLETCTVLTERLRPTLTALKDGLIDFRHAQAMVNEIDGLTDRETDALEAVALPFAFRLTAAKFTHKVRELREERAPETAATRHVTALSEREVVFEPGRDGMATLRAFLPAPEALGIYLRLEDAARELRTAGEGRTMAQLKADVLTDVLLTDLNDPGSAGATDQGPAVQGYRGIRPNIFVTVPVLTLLGRSDAPGSLDGYGPIDAETARKLAAHAPSFTRILIHPESGATLSVGRDSYAVPKDLRTWLQVRDKTCRAPGCARAATRCDIDHTHRWHDGGATDYNNLAHLCRKHHTLKENSDWTVAQSEAGDGTLVWTSPTGRIHTTEPATHLPTSSTGH